MLLSPLSSRLAHSIHDVSALKTISIVTYRGSSCSPVLFCI